MPETVYSASKSRSNRPGWSVNFRHPLRNDTGGKPGLRIRRGLGTTDDTEADKLIAEMNTLLRDRSWWNADRRDAERKFSKAIVEAFFDEIQVGQEDPEALREDLITLPNADDGYSRVLFVGTTGAGKRIRGIYDEAAPILDGLFDVRQRSERFLADVRLIVTGAIDGNGGEVRRTEGRY